MWLPWAKAQGLHHDSQCYCYPKLRAPLRLVLLHTAWENIWEAQTVSGIACCHGSQENFPLPCNSQGDSGSKVCGDVSMQYAGVVSACALPTWLPSELSSLEDAVGSLVLIGRRLLVGSTHSRFSFLRGNQRKEL